MITPFSHLVIGFLVMMVLTAYMTRSLQLLIGSSKRAMTERAEELGGGRGDSSDQIPMTTAAVITPRSEDDIATTTTTTTTTNTPGTLSEAPSWVDVPSSGDLVEPPPRAQSPPGVCARTPAEEADSRASTAAPAADSEDNGMAAQRPPLPIQTPPLPPRAEQWAATVASHLDLCTYGLLFLFVGLPVYYAAGYAMPLQLSFSVLMWFAAMAIPPAWRRYLHPGK